MFSRLEKTNFFLHTPRCKKFHNNTKCILRQSWCPWVAFFILSYFYILTPNCGKFRTSYASSFLCAISLCLVHLCPSVSLISRKQLPHHFSSNITKNLHDSTSNRWFWNLTLQQPSMLLPVTSYVIYSPFLGFIAPHFVFCSTPSAASLLPHNLSCSFQVIHVIFPRVAHRSVYLITLHSLPRQSMLTMASQ